MWFFMSCDHSLYRLWMMKLWHHKYKTESNGIFIHWRSFMNFGRPQGMQFQWTASTDINNPDKESSLNCHLNNYTELVYIS